MKHNPRSSEKSTIWIWGWHSVISALQGSMEKVQTIYVDSLKSYDRFKKMFPHVQPYLLKALQKQLESSNPHAVPLVSQGIAATMSPLASLSLEALHPDKGPVLALDHVCDPHNLGALWRSAAVFGFQSLLFTNDHSPPLEGVVFKAACGGTSHVPYVKVSNLCQALTKLKKKGFFCVGLAETGAEPLSSCQLDPVVLILGSEGDGMRRLTREQCDSVLSISTSPKFSTLNVSAAGAIAMEHFFRTSKVSLH